MAEAKPFLEEIINYIAPEAIIFGGDSGASLFADGHGGRLAVGRTIMGPNGSNNAVYLREYVLTLPYYRSVAAYGIYHPSKLNGHFRREVLPILRNKIGHLLN